MSAIAPLPGLWQIALWIGAALLSIVAGVPMLVGGEPNFGGAVVMFICLTLFVSFGITTWIERLRRRNPALEVTKTGLILWRGSLRETTMPWSQLEKVWESGGSDSHIIFQLKDLKSYGRRTVFGLRAGPSVPVTTAAKDGTRLNAVIQQIWNQFDSPEISQS